MFCPNCGKENEDGQSYCRSCGLKLDAISQAVAELVPSAKTAALQRRKRLIGKLGIASLSIAGVIALMSLIFTAALYKLVLFGPEVLFWASAIALTVFVLLGVGLTVLSKFFMSSEQGMPQTTAKREMDSTLSTGKLIEDRPFEPVPSVIENTTDLLPRKNLADRK